MTELERFVYTWEQETEKTMALLRALPADQYDFRPDPGGRSLGELAWHLAEGDGYVTAAIAARTFSLTTRPPGLERPRTVAALPDAFARVHRDAVARVRALAAADLDDEIDFLSGPTAVRTLLWEFVLMHGVHHRGQLMLLCRLAGGTPPPAFGPTRELMPAQA